MKPVLEVADIFRRHGDAYRQAHGDHMGRVEHRILSAIAACRTATLGGHVEQCSNCGEKRISYNSCLMGKSSNGELAAIGRALAPTAANSDSPLRSTFEERD